MRTQPFSRNVRRHYFGALLLVPIVSVLVLAMTGVADAAITWTAPNNVLATSGLNVGGEAFVYAVSCTSAGNCVAGGRYLDAGGNFQAFVVTESNGVWGTPLNVLAASGLNVDGSAKVSGISCISAGNCLAGGVYDDSSGHIQTFVVTETNGSWGTPLNVLAASGINVGGFAYVNAVSCTSAGNCVAGGYYTDSSGFSQTFVITETNGSWGTPIDVLAASGINVGFSATVRAVSCTSAGNCLAGGVYNDSSGHFQTFVVTETNGSWGTPLNVLAASGINVGVYASVNAVSCTSAGNCLAGGVYADSSGHFQTFVVTETNGSWGTPLNVLAASGINVGGYAYVYAVSCTSAGNCVAGGTYEDGANHFQAFTIVETSGVWGPPAGLASVAALNTAGSASVYAMSCTTVSSCAAGGSYTAGQVGVNARAEEFVTETVLPVPTTTTLPATTTTLPATTTTLPATTTTTSPRAIVTPVVTSRAKKVTTNKAAAVTPPTSVEIVAGSAQRSGVNGAVLLAGGVLLLVGATLGSMALRRRRGAASS